MKKRLCILAALVLIFTYYSYSQENFSGNNAYDYVDKLSSPEYKGRQSGLPGAEAAAEWIAEKFKEFGLEPGGDNQTYFQKFQILVTEEKAPVRFELTNDKRGRVTYYLDYDFDLFTHSGSGKTEAEIVFAGLGISKPGKGRNDYAGIDVRDKIVMIYRGTPADGQDWSKESSRDYRVRVAHEKGAAGLLMVMGENPIKGGALHEDGYFEDLPGFWISRKMGRDIFKYTGINFDNTLQDLPHKIISFNTGKTALMEATVDKITGGETKNVIGILPGTHPELKNEYIVVGGHMDHVGVDGDGNIYPGADDNASGTAVVMELARTIIHGNKEHKRSIIFSPFAAEEQGLLGSTYFVENPPVPKENIVAMFNFDMVGQGDLGIGVSGMERFPEIWENLYQTLPEERKKSLRLGRMIGGGGSDHAPFMRHHIPAIGHFSIGDHPFYHGVEDKINLISPEVLENIGNQSLDFLLAIANYKKPLADGRINERFLFYGGNQADLSLGETGETIPGEQTFKSFKNLNLKGIKIKTVKLSGSENLEQLFTEINSWNRFAEKYDNLCAIATNGNEINRITSSQKMALLVGMYGTKSFRQNPVILKALSKSGLKFLKISDDDRNLFTTGTLSDWGKAFFITCKDNNIAVHIKLNQSLPLKMIFETGGATVSVYGSIDDFNNMPQEILNIIKNSKSTAILTILNSDENPGEIAEFIKDFSSADLKLDFCSLARENVTAVLDFISQLHGDGISYEKLASLLNVEILR